MVLKLLGVWCDENAAWHCQPNSPKWCFWVSVSSQGSALTDTDQTIPIQLQLNSKQIKGMRNGMQDGRLRLASVQQQCCGWIQRQSHTFKQGITDLALPTLVCLAVSCSMHMNILSSAFACLPILKRANPLLWLSEVWVRSQVFSSPGLGVREQRVLRPM